MSLKLLKFELKPGYLTSDCFSLPKWVYSNYLVVMKPGKAMLYLLLDIAGII